MPGKRRITKRRLDPSSVIDRTFTSSAGGTVVFIGTIRNKGTRGRVTALEYQVYEDMAEKAIRGIETETKRKWPVKKIEIVHREGLLRVGEVSVIVAVSAEHRAEAFEACRFAIDKVKSSVPIWKKEILKEGSTWVEGTPIGGN